MNPKSPVAKPRQGGISDAALPEHSSSDFHAYPDFLRAPREAIAAAVAEMKQSDSAIHFSSDGFIEA